MTAHDESQRPWGRYEILQESATHKTKCIYVLPGKRLSYQRHQKRAEHWFIVSGRGTAELDGKEIEVGPGDTIDVPIGCKHRVSCHSAEPLVFIEVQTGSSFDESDIVRHSDDFGRN
jgi:mannose-6-phosphate isomerase